MGCVWREPNAGVPCPFQHITRCVLVAFIGAVRILFPRKIYFVDMLEEGRRNL